MVLPVTDPWNQNTGSEQPIATYSAAWTVLEGGMQVPPGNVGRLEGTGGTYNTARRNDETFDADQYSEMVFNTTGGSYKGPAVRCQSGANTSYHVDSNGSEYYMSKCLAGTQSTLAGPVSISPALVTGDILRLEVTGIGGTVTLKVFKALAASPTSFTQVGSDITDSSSPITTAGSAGVFVYGVTSGGGAGAWTAGNLAAADTTAPVLTSPTGTATGTTTATVGATTDEGNGTLYAFVSTSATPPAAATLKAGTGAAWSGSQAVSTTGAKTLSATGLTASTGYYAHLIHADAANNDSNIVTSAQFTTQTPNANPNWTGTPSAMSSKRGQALTPQDITSLVTDTDPLTYSLTGAPTGVTINSSTGIISGTPTAAPNVYACTVQADDGINAPASSASFNITVVQCVLALNASGYEFGDGNAPATLALLASTELQVAAYPLAEWPPASAIATVTATTGTNGRLADLGDNDLSFGTTYRVIARNAANGETWAWTMAAS